MRSIATPWSCRAFLDICDKFFLLWIRISMFREVASCFISEIIGADLLLVARCRRNTFKSVFLSISRVVLRPYRVIMSSNSSRCCAQVDSVISFLRRQAQGHPALLQWCVYVVFLIARKRSWSKAALTIFRQSLLVTCEGRNGQQPYRLDWPGI